MLLRHSPTSPFVRKVTVTAAEIGLLRAATVTALIAAFFTVANGVAFIPIIFAGALADLFGVVKVLIAMGLLLLVIGAIQIAIASQTPGRTRV
jgi:MFS family permease